MTQSSTLQTDEMLTSLFSPPNLLLSQKQNKKILICNDKENGRERNNKEISQKLCKRESRQEQLLSQYTKRSYTPNICGGKNVIEGTPSQTSSWEIMGTTHEGAQIRNWNSQIRQSIHRNTQTLHTQGQQPLPTLVKSLKTWDSKILKVQQK